VAYVVGSDALRVERYNGLTWASIAWTYNGNVVALRVLGVYASDTTGDALVGYERVGPDVGTLWCTRVNASDGLGAASVQSFTTLPLAYFWQIGFDHYDSGDVALVVEWSDQSLVTLAIPNLAYVLVRGSTASPASDEHRAYHVRMLSEPFTYAGARETPGTDVNCYVGAAYKDATAANEFSQRNGFILNLDVQNWVDSGDNTIRPRQVSTMNLGEIDARVSGYTPDLGLIAGFAIGRRVNHVSHASAAHIRGPKLKSRTMALIGFGKLMQVSSSSEAPFQPVHAKVTGYHFYMEEPWTIHRDPSDPPAPSVTFMGESPYTVGDGVEAGAGFMFTGGTPSYYDGKQVFEVGYAWNPEPLDVRFPGVGDVDEGTHLYTFTYAQRDAAGQLHRSAPSAPISVEVAAGGQIVEIDVNTMTISMRDNVFHYPGAQPIEVEWWRTEAGGIVFHRVFAQLGASNLPQETPANDPTTYFVTGADNVADADLLQQELLPFALLDGAFTPLTPFQPPAASAITKHQNRVFLASSQDDRVIFYSNELLPEPGGSATLAPEFSLDLALRIDGIGRITAMQTWDTSLIVFTATSVYSVTGFGADPGGNGQSFQVELLQEGVGCIEPRSVVLTPAGTFFQSHKGLYLLSVNGSLEHVGFGAKVEDDVFTAGNIRSATHIDDRPMALFVTSGVVGEPTAVIVYDYQEKRWSRWVLPLAAASSALSTAAGGTCWQGANREILHVVLQAGQLMVEKSPDDTDPYTDEDPLGDVEIPLVVETGYFHLDGIAGYKRLNRVVTLVDNPSGSTIRVTIWDDEHGTYAQAVPGMHEFDPGETRPRFGPARQKGAAFKLRFEERSPIPTGEPWRLVGVELLIGIKRGLARR